MANTEAQSTQVSDKLSSHPLVREILDLVVPLITDESRTKLTPTESYNLEIFDNLSALIQSFDSLERSRNFGTHLPSTKYLQSLNINRHDWIEYQVSTFLIIFVAVGDEALLLVNSMFYLGIDPKHCRVAIVKQNKWVMETSIPKHLGAIEKVIEPHRNSRNLFVHRGKVPSLSSLFKLDSLDQLKTISFAFQVQPQNFPDITNARLDAAYVKALLKIGETLDGEVSQLKNAVWELLNSLHQYFNQRLGLLSSGAMNDSRKK